MQLDHALDDLFESRAHVQVLRAIVGLPDGVAVSARDIARRAGIAHTTAARALRSLAGHGVLHAQRAGRADLYGLNDGHAFASQVRALFTAESAMRRAAIDHVAAVLARRAGPLRAAYLFGSVARGGSRPDSDIDIAIVGARAPQAELEPILTSLADDIRERYGAELNVIVDRPGARRRAPIWQRIEREGLRILPRGSGG